MKKYDAENMRLHDELREMGKALTACQQERDARWLENYRAGYSCGYNDAQRGAPMRDEAAGRLFFRLPPSGGGK